MKAERKYRSDRPTRTTKTQEEAEQAELELLCLKTLLDIFFEQVQAGSVVAREALPALLDDVRDANNMPIESNEPLPLFRVERVLQRHGL